MKSKEEIEALAFKEYPKPIQLNSLAFDIQNSAVREKERKAFIKGYEMAQDETHLPPKLMAGQEFFDAIERTTGKTLLLDEMAELINALILDNYRVKPPTK